MRRSETVCELNVLAQFKKYDVSKLHRGFITPDGIETVLKEEGVSPEAIRDYIEEFMSLDSNGDGKVSFLDLYESMMARIPDEWLEWIDTKFVLWIVSSSDNCVSVPAFVAGCQMPHSSKC